jgi:GNAT superfamily N-acetyltransferase
LSRGDAQRQDATVQVRRVDGHEWAKLRDIRLRALAEAPYAFATTHEEGVAQPDAYWHEMLRYPAWIAEEAGTWMGMVRVRPEGNAAHLISMWVDPVARNRGVGRKLVDAVVAWARGHGIGEVSLWVAEGNAPAEALYLASGFAPTGERQPLPSNPAVMEQAMRLDLPAPS